MNDKDCVRPERLLSGAELAHRWGISAATLRNWRWSGRAPVATLLGRCVRYRLADIERFEQANRSTSTSANRR